MTRTGPADVVVSGHGLATPCRPILTRSDSRGPRSRSDRDGSHESTVARAVFPGSGSVKPAHGRLAGRPGRLWPAYPPLRRPRAQTAHLPHPPCPRQPALVHPVYLYPLGWRSAPPYGWSFDPGRDILCLLLSPPRWLQWP